MKQFLTLSVMTMLLAVLVNSCSPTQKITSSWVDRDALPEDSYKKVCVLAIIPKEEMRNKVEEHIVKFIKKRKLDAVKSLDILPDSLAGYRKINKTELAALLEKTGCDGLMTISLLDIKTEDRYTPGSKTVYTPPFSYLYYNDYQSYFSYRNSQTSQPGYMTKETTYYFESNFYDVGSKALLWSFQSDAFAPTDFDTWFSEYSKIMMKELREEGIVRK
ncbi:hypothetical protein [Mangrovibacterium lignilyticum]|uniref:hypothetical protein n=1 Tax=Mangrovibacterium lignilyticum TaxID=2668052 RepID=UPI0013CF6F02|nr:hypothetical protein [Mangrovibacterium lignilyticum]